MVDSLKISLKNSFIIIFVEKPKHILSEKEILENEREQQREGENHENFRHRENEQHNIFGLDKETLKAAKEIFGRRDDSKQLNRIEDKLDEILRWIASEKLRRRAVGFRFKIQKPNGEIIIVGDKFKMAFRKNQTFPITLEPVDASGQPTTLDGDPVWSSSDESVCTVTPNPDNPLQATGQTSDTNTGDAIIKAVGDGNLDQGEGEVNLLEDSGLVSVLGNDAVGINLTFGTPTDVPPA